MLTSVTSAASAQTAPVVVPPHVVQDPGAEYPRQAVLDHVAEAVTVVLVLDVDEHGAVTKATPATPHGHGFDEAAVASVLALTFEPATRDGKPIKARIKFQRVFVPPLGRLVGRLSTTATDRSLAGARVTASGPGASFTAETDAKGNFVLEGLAAGAYELQVSAPGFEPLRSTERIEPGTETTAAFRLDRESRKPKPQKRSPPKTSTK